MVLFEFEPGAIGVELLRAVDVGDRDRDQLELQVHGPDSTPRGRLN